MLDVLHLTYERSCHCTIIWTYLFKMSTSCRITSYKIYEWGYKLKFSIRLNRCVGMKETYNNGCRIYVDIMTGGKLAYIMVANMIIFYFAVRSSKSVRGEWVKGMDGGIVILPAMFYFIRVHDILV